MKCDACGLANELKIKTGSKVMLMTNINIQDRLIDGPFGTIVHCKSRNERVEIICVRFNVNNANLEAQRKD